MAAQYTSADYIILSGAGVADKDGQAIEKKEIAER